MSGVWSSGLAPASLRAAVAGTCLGAAVAAAPLELLATVPLGPLQISTAEVILALALVAALGLGAADGRLRPESLRAVFWSQPLQRVAIVGLVLWPTWHVLSALWSTMPLASAKFGLRVAAGNAAGLAVWLWAGEPLFRQRFVRVLAGAGLLMTALALGERALGRTIEPLFLLFRHEPTWMLGEQRLSITFDHANVCAGYFELMVPIAVALAGASKRLTTRLLWLGVAAVQAILLSLTYSRAGLGAALVGMIVLGLAAFGARRLRLAAVSVVLGATVLGAYTLNPEMRARVGIDERSYQVHIVKRGPCRGHAGSAVQVPFRIHNRGTWPLSNRHAPGNLIARLLTERGQSTDTPEWLTVPLPDLPPGLSADVTLTVPLPKLATRYALAVDIERDHVIHVSEVTGKLHWFRCAAVAPGTPLQTVSVPSGQTARPPEADERLGRRRLLDLERRHYWRAALLLIHNKPWLGWGADQFRRRSGEYLPPGGHDDRARAHSLWLETWSGLGLVGVIILLLWLFPVLRSVQLAVLGSRRPAPARAGRTTAWLAAAGLAAILLHSQVDHFLAYGKIAPIFWSLVGLLLATAGGWPWPANPLLSLLRRRDPLSPSL